MVMILSPFPKLRFCDNNGNALVGGKLFTYIAGTIATKTASYVDSGGTPNTNPVILDSRGEANVWLDPAVSYKFALAPANDTDPPTNSFFVIDNIVPPVGSTVTLATVPQSLAGTSTTLAGTPKGTANAIQQGFTFGTNTGTANAIVVSPSITPIALADGMRAQWRSTLTNTGATTLNYGGLGTVDVKKWSLAGPVALGGGEIVVGNLNAATYVSAVAAWVLDSPNGASLWPTGTINGLTLSRSSATAFGVAAGLATSEQAGTQQDLTLTSAITKTLSAFVAGTGNGGLDTGAVAATTWYHVHLIRNDVSGSVDALYSLSPTAPTMPAGFTPRRRIGSILTNGASQIVAFSQLGDEFLWDAAVIDADATNPGTAAVTRLLTVPTGVKVLAMVSIGGYTGTNGFTIVASSLDVSDQAAQVTGTAGLVGFPSNAAVINGAQWDFSTHLIRTNTSGQIRTRLSASGAADHIGIVTRGWIDVRGK